MSPRIMKSAISRNQRKTYTMLVYDVFRHFFPRGIRKGQTLLFRPPLTYHLSAWSLLLSLLFTGHSLECVSFKRCAYVYITKDEDAGVGPSHANGYSCASTHDGTYTRVYVWRLNAASAVAVTRRTDGALNPNGHKVDVWQNRPFRLYSNDRGRRKPARKYRVAAGAEGEKLGERNTIKINPSVIYIRPNKTRYDFCGRIIPRPVPLWRVRIASAVRACKRVRVCVCKSRRMHVIGFLPPALFLFNLRKNNLARAGEIFDLRQERTDGRTGGRSLVPSIICHSRSTAAATTYMRCLPHEALRARDVSPKVLHYSKYSAVLLNICTSVCMCARAYLFT